MMIREIKEIVINYSLVGLVVMFFTILIRPFVNVRTTIRDCAIVFCFSVMSGLLLEHWADILNESVRTGISGVCGFFAVRIYEVLIALMEHAARNPEKIVDKFKKD